MLETRIKIIENRPDRLVYTESVKPWPWGGFSLDPSQVIMLVAYPFIKAVKGSNRVSIDTAYQSMTIESRGFFSGRKKEYPFRSIESIVVSPRNYTPTTGGQWSAVHPIHLGELTVILNDETRLNAATAYWNDHKLKDIGRKISELTGKPFDETGNSEE
ncbi:MAG: hypothetical protein JW712_00150 [Dehalococcoidales bacterium]|nr:hypothetical protein [Dehalococcoidales bacterium]